MKMMNEPASLTKVFFPAGPHFSSLHHYRRSMMFKGSLVLNPVIQCIIKHVLDGVQELMFHRRDHFVAT